MLIDRDRGVAYREKRRDSPRESINPRAESRSNRTLWLDWATRQQSVAELLGYSYVGVEGPTGANYIARRTPQPHPDWGHFPVYASEASELIGEIPSGRSAGDVGAFDEARTTLNYTSLRYDVLTDEQLAALLPQYPINQREGYFMRYVEVTEKPAASYVTIPSNWGLTWESDNANAALKAFYITYHVIVTIKWMQVPLEAYRDFASDGGPGAPIGFMECVGCTNSFTMGRAGSRLTPRGPSTMIQGCPSKEIYRMPNGGLAVDVTVPYRYDPHGSNYFFRIDKAGGPGFEGVKRPDGSKLYPLKDLSLPYTL